MKILIPNSRLPERYNVRRETIWRWRNDPQVGFPPPDAIINGQEYRSAETLDAFDAASVRRAVKKSKP
jgi:hypothetical protein